MQAGETDIPIDFFDSQGFDSQGHGASGVARRAVRDQPTAALASEA
jgi:hypothetical protein